MRRQQQPRPASQSNTGAAIPGGSPLGVFVLPGSNDLDGPRGIIRLGDRLLVASQNQSKDGVAGQILRYKLFDGRPDGAFVPSGPKSPFTADGIIYWRGVVYASDISISDTPIENLPPGRLLAYDAKTGKLLREFNPNTFPSNFPFPIKFHPRGLVIGPNGLLYVASLPDVQPNPALRLGGQILVFDPETFDFLGVFINDAGGPNALNRPDGLVFGPDGKLYVTSFRASPDDSDSIRIYDGHTGVSLTKSISTRLLRHRTRALSRKALSLVPAASSSLPSPAATPDHRPSPDLRCEDEDVRRDSHDYRRSPNPASLWYLTFGKTNPGTLAYDQDDNHGGPKHD